MIKYEVGNFIEGYPKWYPEGVRFDVSDSGASIIAFFDNPRKEEVKEFKSGKIKLGYYTYKNVIFLLIKVGNLPWMDSPYSVYLSKNLTKKIEINEGNKIGISIVIYLVNGKNGMLESLRLIGASNRLSSSLIKDIEIQKEMTFELYYQNMNYVFNNYSTKELVKRAKIIENMHIIK